MRVIYGAIGLLLVTQPTAGFAARLGTASKPEQSDCLAILRGWSGSLEETRNISEKPVPESYSKGLTWGGCQSLDKPSLIDWHLAFGDEASVTAALQFLAQAATKGIPPIAEFEARLPKVLQRARAFTRKIQPEYARNWAAADAIVLGSAEFAQLADFADAYDRYSLLATQYLRASEFYRSPTLLRQGTVYLSPTMRGLAILYGDQRIGMSIDGSRLDDLAGLAAKDINHARDLEMRYAIARADFSRSPADIAAAEKMVASNADPVMQLGAEALLDRGADFCRSTRADALLKAACDNENNLTGRLRNYWQNRTRLELIASQPTPPDREFRTFGIAEKAIETSLTRYGDGAVLRYVPEMDDLVFLLLTRAEANLRKSDAESLGTERQGLRARALGDLVTAARSATPVLNPGRFRQIARLYLATYKAMIDSGSTNYIDTDTARQAAYFETVLAHLDRIKIGVSTIPTR